MCHLSGPDLPSATQFKILDQCSDFICFKPMNIIKTNNSRRVTVMEMAVEIQTNHADDPKSKSQRLNEPTLIPYFSFRNSIL